MKAKRHLFFDPERCTGCQLCELACSQVNAGEYNPDLSTIRLMSHPDLGTNLLCIQSRPCICGDGSESCTEICNVGAIRFVDDEEVPSMLKDRRWLAAPVVD
ncbi:MAG: 4Fe-4S binding protein [Desulfobacterales bacterium]|nr:4Fe-4S binding protein [Desulfobacterales bacterium]